MQVRLTTPSELSQEETAAWSRFQEQSPEFDSPYFRPEFSRAVADIRDDVEVAILTEGGSPAGFFPFQRSSAHHARPVGGRLSDYQGVIGRPNLEFDATELIRACDLNVLDFDHMLSSQTPFTKYHRFTDRSPYLDLSSGFEVYRSSLRLSARNSMRHTLRLSRKLSREIAPIRCEFFSTDTEAFDNLLNWKSEQYRTTKITDVFAFPWTKALLRRIWEEQTPSFQGVLSVLYTGDRAVACHFGMRSGKVLHWWFPAYDREFSRYAPGRVLLTMAAQQCNAYGIEKIDMGRGVATYKSLVMSGTTEVAVGSVDLRPVARCLRNGWRQTRAWIRNSPLYTPARIPGRIIHRISEWVQFQ
ncbi:MAG: GNAT family N-acetyltransferase [Planctomycetaceae bacterium]|nr:GNAT family N-acetyltransferase [Planctomycetales bacterium]MCB9874932.1 GNAT family N-acetyltransferase [Planctomycetaceae bacterium]MCB9923788.1 GNAT family N-acetyltransferase [Planctomycetaceae bacterium]